MNLIDYFNNTAAKDSIIFWIFIGIIIFIIGIISLREFFCWYFKINEIKKTLNEINKKLETINIPQKQKINTDLYQENISNDSEIAAVIAALKKFKKI